MPKLSPSQIASILAEHTRTCANCDEVFQPKHPRQSWCSSACKQAIGAERALDRFCLWCGDLLVRDNPKAKFCSDKCRLTSFKSKPCRYCGEPANSRDHFIPTVFVQRVSDFARVDKSIIIVPACLECNQTAGDKVFNTIKQKRNYIGRQYQKRYAKLIEAPNWTYEEVEELGFMLRSHVERNESVKLLLRKRLNKLLK